MPADFSQFLHLEIARLPGVGPIRRDFDSRQQLDSLSVDQILQYFQRFLRLNYLGALRGAELMDVARTIAGLRSQAESSVLHYDVTVGRGQPIGNYFDLINNPTPRERLVDQLEAVGSRIATKWQAVVAPVRPVLGNHKARTRPLRPGYSVGNEHATFGSRNGAGTIAGFIRARSGIYLLSNAHVLALDPFANHDNSGVCQPGPTDGGGEVVGDVVCHMPLRRGSPNAMDAAVARLRPGVGFSFEYEDVGPLTGMREARVGETLTMIARTTGKVSAVVQEVLCTRDVIDWTNPYGKHLSFCGVTVLKRAQGLFTNLAGDSGGLWIGEDNKAVALNFAGGEDSDTAFACPISIVIAYFQVHLDDDRAGLIGIDNATFWASTRG